MMITNDDVKRKKTMNRISKKLITMFLICYLLPSIHTVLHGMQGASAMPLPMPMPQAQAAVKPLEPAAPVITPPAPLALPMPVMSPPAPAALPTPVITQPVPVPSIPVALPVPAAAPVMSPPVSPTLPAPIITPPVPAAATSIAAPTPANSAASEATIYLNFENADLSSFIDYMADIKKINVIPDKALEGSKISLMVRQALTPDEAWNIFLTVLEMAGFSIVKVGLVHKIIPKDKKLMEPLPSYFNVPVDQLPESDLTIRYVCFLTNIRVESVRPILESMLSQPNTLIAQPDMNAFIITDKSYNIRSAVKLIQELDETGMPEEVTVLKLKQVNADDTKGLLDSLISKKADANPLARLLGKVSEGSTEYFNPSTKIISEPRTNSLILLGTRESIQRIVDFITKHIDTTLQGAGSPLHIYELQHIDAKQVMDILKEVTKTDLETVTGQTAAKFGSIRGGVKYFKQMNFQVDKDGNRLIVNSIDKQDWELLKKTLQDLDKPQPQVAIESLFVMVNSQDIKKLGGMLRNKKHGQLGTNIDFQSSAMGNTQLEYVNQDPNQQPVSLLGNVLGALVPEQGQTVLTFGKAGVPGNIWSVFRILKTQTNASVLSQPFITVANKKEAKVEVGETRRVLNTQSQGSTVNAGYISLPALTTLKVVPQINLDGVTRLKIEVSIKDFGDAAGDIILEKTMTTDASVADGQVLVLGGFVETKVDESVSKTPILGDIPILGWFFKNKQRTTSKQYLFIFLSPTIIKPRKTPGMQLYTKMKLHNATNNIEDAVETKKTMDPVYNWFFNPDGENYSHKVIDFANARYQPTTVDIANDPWYRSATEKDQQYQQETAESPVETQQSQKVLEEKFVSGNGSDTNQQPTIVPLVAKPVIPDGSGQTILSQPAPVVTNSPVSAIAAQEPVVVSPSPVVSQPVVVAQPETIIPEPIIPQQPVMVPTLVEKQDPIPQFVEDKEEIDTVLQEKRNKLKQLFASQTKQGATDVPVGTAVRQSFKETLSPKAVSQNENVGDVDLDKRNVLKKFLSASASSESKGKRHD